jgi:hypothetical protein
VAAQFTKWLSLAGDRPAKFFGILKKTLDMPHGGIV